MSSCLPPTTGTFTDSDHSLLHAHTYSVHTYSAHSYTRIPRICCQCVPTAGVGNVRPGVLLLHTRRSGVIGVHCAGTLTLAVLVSEPRPVVSCPAAPPPPFPAVHGRSLVVQLLLRRSLPVHGRSLVVQLLRRRRSLPVHGRSLVVQLLRRRRSLLSTVGR